MGLLERVKGLFGISWGGVSTATTYMSAREWSLGLPDAPSTSFSDPYANHPSVSIAIRTIAEDAASVDWEFYTEAGNDDTKIEDHPVLRLWKRPNLNMTGSDLWVASYTNFKLWGECWWYYPDLRVGRSGGARASERSTGDLILLDPRLVTVKMSESGQLTHWLRVDGEDKPLESDRLTMFRRYNPYNPHRGLSEVDAIRLELEADTNSAQWNKQFFGEHNGVPTGLLKPPVDNVVPSKDRDDYLQQWNTRHARRRSIGLLPPGWDWVGVGAGPKDMDFRGLREYAREQTLAVFGVPPFRAGVLDKANYANAREQKDVYWNGTITRMLEYFQGVINNDFLPKIGVTGVEVYPCYETVKSMTDNLTEKAEIATKLFAIGFTKRQLNDRLELGLDADELEDPDVGYISTRLTPVSMAGKMATPFGTPAGDDGPPEGGDLDDEDPLEGRGYGVKLVDASGPRRSLVWRHIALRVRDIEDRFARLARSHFADIEREVLGNLAGLKGWMLGRGMKAEWSDLFNIQLWKERLSKSAEPLHREALKRGGDSIMVEVGVDFGIEMVDVRVLAKLAELSYKIKRIDDTIEKILREALLEGVNEGESPQELSKRVREVMDASKSRAMTIARTETGSAFNAGRFVAMQQAGVKRQEWLTADDSVVRDSHDALDGNVIDIGGVFANGLRYPNDSAGPPEEVINCRCTVVPVMESAR